MKIKNLHIVLLLMSLVIPVAAYADTCWKNNGRHSTHYGWQSYGWQRPNVNRYAGNGYNYGHYTNQGHYHNQGHYGRPSYGYGIGEQAIRQGIQTGRLSQREVWELRADQRDIQRQQAAYYADGVLTKRERNELRDDISDFNKDLRHELNDGERRKQTGWRYPYSWLRGW